MPFNCGGNGQWTLVYARQMSRGPSPGYGWEPLEEFFVIFTFIYLLIFFGGIFKY